MSRFVFAWIGNWLAELALIMGVRSTTLRTLIGWLLPLGGVGLLLYTSPLLQPWQRLLASSVGMLYLLKGTILLQYPLATLGAFSKPGLLLFLTIWPGMDPEPLRRRQLPSGEAGSAFVRGFLWLCLGALALAGTALLQPLLGSLIVGWLGLLALLLLIHFGYAELLTASLRLAGWQVPPLFDRPLGSRSLREFWGRRWNLAFVEMDRRLFLRPLRRWLGKPGALLGVFAVSGLLHELAISYPAGAGWGGPLLYFMLQGALVALEFYVLRVERWPSLLLRRLWTWVWLIAPLPLLFHSGFRDNLIEPLFAWLHQLLAAHPLIWYFDWALRLAALGHGCVLIASSQVPARLRWKEDLAKLTPFNRKIMWTYGGFIVLCIVSFGLLTWVLHDDFLQGAPAALGLALFNGGFWGARVGVDLFYFRHADWPPGPAFQIGHVLLTTLFVYLTITYFGLVIWHFVG